jgi:hypothetical protein
MYVSAQNPGPWRQDLLIFTVSGVATVWQIMFLHQWREIALQTYSFNFNITLLLVKYFLSYPVRNSSETSYITFFRGLYMS